MIRGIARKYFKVKPAYFVMSMGYTSLKTRELSVNIVKDIIRLQK